MSAFNAAMKEFLDDKDIGCVAKLFVLLGGLAIALPIFGAFLNFNVWYITGQEVTWAQFFVGGLIIFWNNIIGRINSAIFFLNVFLWSFSIPWVAFVDGVKTALGV